MTAPKHHVLITGTGRAGTTFIVELLTHIGIDTGFDMSELEKRKNPVSSAGLEYAIHSINAPYIIKAPSMMVRMNDILKNRNYIIDHIFVPFRNIKDAAASRERIFGIVGTERFSGSLFGTSNPDEQEMALWIRLERFLLAISNHNVPVTFIHFPRLIHDPEYLYLKLSNGIKLCDKRVFIQKHKLLSNPKLVHKFNKNNV